MNLDIIAQICCFLLIGALGGYIFALIYCMPKVTIGNYDPRLLADNQFFRATETSEIFQIGGKKLSQEFTTCVTTHTSGVSLRFFVFIGGGIQAVFANATKETHYVDVLKETCKGYVCVEMFWCDSFQDVRARLEEIANRTGHLTIVSQGISAVAATCLSRLPQVERSYKETLAELQSEQEDE